MSVRAGARMRTRTRTDTRHHTRRTMGQVTLLGSPVPSASGPPERRGSTDPDGENHITKVLIKFLHVTNRWRYLYTKNHPCSLFGGRNMSSQAPIDPLKARY